MNGLSWVKEWLEGQGAEKKRDDRFPGQKGELAQATGLVQEVNQATKTLNDMFGRLV